MLNTVGTAILEGQAYRRRLDRLAALVAFLVEGAGGGAPLTAAPYLDQADRAAEALAELEGVVAQALAAGRLPGGRSGSETAATLAALAAERERLGAALGRALRRGVAAGARSPAELALPEARIWELEEREVGLQADLAAYLWTTAPLG